nr:MAG TPA: hypothetical protein [Caudoviricetes sp.]DAK07552.1 MAG TPA: hypothetical protein [Caudoviricetes sp.]DAQ02648.1 MAG TPA: hypothetical protein [Caudoviricetes sp.]DAQ78653.1 MAG TPA: hypothetical protein [Caudoviricetes sp.]DAT35387.1 MAG TPA: hypothetical protein [Caudoviricetes sp.]
MGMITPPGQKNPVFLRFWEPVGGVNCPNF